MLCHPAGLHIWRWFLELSRTRSKHTIVMAGMAGSQIITELAAITWAEIASWQAVTGRALTQFESRILTIMDNIYVAAVNGGKGQNRQGQGLGEYCHGKDVEECRQMFGAALERICSTCPN